LKPLMADTAAGSHVAGAIVGVYERVARGDSTPEGLRWHVRRNSRWLCWWRRCDVDVGVRAAAEQAAVDRFSVTSDIRRRRIPRRPR